MIASHFDSMPAPNPPAMGLADDSLADDSLADDRPHPQGVVNADVPSIEFSAIGLDELVALQNQTDNFGVGAELFNDFDFMQFGLPSYGDIDFSLANIYGFTALSSPETDHTYPDIYLPMPRSDFDNLPPPSSSPIASSSTSQYNVPSSPAPMVLSPASTESVVDNVADLKGKKRARDEVDERFILPAGTRRATTKPSREPLMVSSGVRI